MELSQEHIYWVLLSSTAGIGPQTFAKLITLFGTAREAYFATEQQLTLAGLSKKTSQLLIRRRGVISPDRYFQMLDQKGVSTLCAFESDYPPLLKQIPYHPPVLYVKGHLRALGVPMIAVVGSRKPTLYGRQMTEQITHQLVELGLGVVSGLARGIDGIAHRVAVESQCPTVAFLGGGIDTIYPAEHRGLAMKIMEVGALVSEFPPGSATFKGNFPARNRLISGLSLGVLLIEGQQGSGTMHTIDHALKQGKLVFALPGQVNSPGSQLPIELISQAKARMVRDGNELVTALYEAGLYNTQPVRAMSPELPQQQFDSDIEELIYLILETEPLESDDIIRQSTLSSQEVLTALTMMELRGLIRRDGVVYSVVR